MKKLLILALLVCSNAYADDYGMYEVGSLSQDTVLGVSTISESKGSDLHVTIRGDLFYIHPDDRSTIRKRARNGIDGVFATVNQQDWAGTEVVGMDSDWYGNLYVTANTRIVGSCTHTSFPCPENFFTITKIWNIR